MPNASDVSYCSPRPDGRTYEGFHLKSLVAYETEWEAQQVADTYDAEVFYCEYGDCYHIGGSRRAKLYGRR